MFIGIAVIPTSAQKIEKLSLTMLRGSTLYVGGSGPWNYSSIQAAINASSDGDTVFVYAASSPYYENIIINKSINLIGEDRNTTVIDGKRTDDPVWIRTSDVTVCGFTLSNGSIDGWHAGIFIIERKWGYPCPTLTHEYISNCIIQNDRCGIWSVNVSDLNLTSCFIHDNPSHSIFLVTSTHVNISNCEISHNGNNSHPGGIVISGNETLISDNVSVGDCSISYNRWDGILIDNNAHDIDIHHNAIFENENFGICVLNSTVKIHNNHIYNNGMNGSFDAGIFLQDCVHKTTIKDNTIETNNRNGVYLLRSLANLIKYNNFIHNKQNAYFKQFSLFNHWEGNYWTDWVSFGPKLIIGKLGSVSFPWINFDWHPAQEPYDIV
jgi:parallel beta-helix repeat protein